MALYYRTKSNYGYGIVKTRHDLTNAIRYAIINAKGEYYPLDICIKHGYNDFEPLVVDVLGSCTILTKR